MSAQPAPRRRILEVNKFYPPHVGGIERVVQDLAKEFGRRGHRVRVLACRSTRGTRRVEWRDGAVVIYAASFATVCSTPLSLDFFLLYLRLRRWAEIVHWHEPCPPATLAALLMPGRAARVVTWHADIARWPLLRPLVVRLQRAALARAARVVATSRALADGSAVLGAAAVTAEPIPIGLALPARATDGTRAPALGRHALFIGRLVYYKGLDVLLAAMSLTDATLVMVGNGPMLGEVQAEIARRRLDRRVRLVTRRVDDAELDRLYRACDFLVLPSTHPAEAFGMVQVEAMARGKPVINTRLPTGVPAVSLDGHTGITVPPGDAVALASAIHRLWHDPEFRARLGAAGRERAYREFDRTVMAERYLALFDRILPLSPTTAARLACKDVDRDDG